MHAQGPFNNTAIGFAINKKMKSNRINTWKVVLPSLQPGREILNKKQAGTIHNMVVGKLEVVMAHTYLYQCLYQLGGSRDSVCPDTLTCAVMIRTGGY